jgi:SpoVK/Ycf46/Vps4 family AAA+-type ATPase
MPIASDVNIDELVSRTEGYSGAEVSLLLYMIKYSLFIEVMKFGSKL